MKPRLGPGLYGHSRGLRTFKPWLGVYRISWRFTISEDFEVLEHKFFDEKGKFLEEINLIFNVKIHESSIIKSGESHLEFFFGLI